MSYSCQVDNSVTESLTANFLMSSLNCLLYGHYYLFYHLNLVEEEENIGILAAELVARWPSG